MVAAMPNPFQDQVYLNAISDLSAATSAADRSAVVRRVAGLLQVTEQTVYAHLRRLGWSSGRKARADKGQSCVSVEDLTPVATIMATGRNKRGEPNIPTSEAHRIAAEQQMAAAQVSVGHLRRRLRQEGLSMEHLRAPKGAIPQVSTHPNQRWYFDISTAIQWKFVDPTTGRRLALYTDAGARFYEGKVENFKQVEKYIRRFCMVDHYSGAYFVQYFYASGERAEDVVDFFWRAMAPKEGLTQAFPFRGRPTAIVMDQGGANRSALVSTLLAELGVGAEYHAPGNPRASGTVESRHNHWQRSFEGRLALEPAPDLETLNKNALQQCALMNAERPHSRHGHPPMAIWATISAEQLREAPDRATFFQLATAQAREATLDNYQRLRADGRKWLISGPNTHARQKVTFRLAPFQDNGIRVWDANGVELAAEELAFNEAGFATSGPRREFDNPEQAGASLPAAPAQAIAKAVEADQVAARATLPVEDVFGASRLQEQLDRQAYLAPKQGQAWLPSVTPLAASPKVGSLEAREEVIRRLGRGLSPAEGQWWRERVAEGVTLAELEELFTTFMSPGVSHARQQHG